MGAIVLTEQDPARELGRVVLVEPVEQGNVEVSLPGKFTVDKRTEL